MVVIALLHVYTVVMRLFKIQLHFLACVLANDLPHIKPYDDALNNHTHIINCEKVFINEPSNQFEILKDNNINQEMKSR